jgi:hypothetical protein
MTAPGDLGGPVAGFRGRVVAVPFLLLDTAVGFVYQARERRALNDEAESPSGDAFVMVGPGSAGGAYAAISRIPAATTTAAMTRRRPNGSLKNTVPISAPKITLVSRSAAIGASWPRVCAHSTRP